MADFTVRQGDDFTITDTLEDADGNPVNLQGATVTLTMIPVAGGAAKIDAAAAANQQTGDGTDGSKGKVAYTGTSADSDTAGVYLGSWTVTYSGGDVQTFPNGSYILIAVTADSPVAASTRFADSTDLEARLGVSPFTADEHIRANRLLADATGLIQDEIGQTLVRVAGDVLTIPGTTDERILLPQRPVVSVQSVTLDGTALVEGGDWYLEGNELVRVPSSLTLGIGGLLDTEFTFPLGTGFGWEEQTLVITYTHGYADVPELCKRIAVEMAVRVWVNPGSVIEENLAGEQTIYAPYAAPPRGLMLTDDETKRLRRRFGRKAYSLRLDGGQ